MGDRVERLLEVHKAHIEWLLVLACLMHRYSEIRDLVSCPPALSESACSSSISVSVFSRILSSMMRLFSDIGVLQCSVAPSTRFGEIFNNHFTANLLQNQPEKE